MVYSSAHLSLAALEILVHSQPLMPRDTFLIFSIQWAEALAKTIPMSSLPKSWTNQPAGAATVEIGDRWCKERSSAVLTVPSVLVPEEQNYLLNPLRQDYAKLQIKRVRDFQFDPRFRH